MAWQTPKTNWAAADGVRDTDMNRIEGNILALYEESARTSKIIYVSMDGDDDAGNGTSSNPYRSITKALSVVPKNLAGLNVNIHIASGTYLEAVSVKGFHGGPIRFTGSGSDVEVTSITVDNCALLVSSITLLLTASVSLIVTNGGLFSTTGDVAAEGVSTGVNVNLDSCVHITGRLSCAGSAYAVNCSGSSRLYADSITGVGIITVSTGGSVAFNSSSMNRNTATGGRVYTGSQSGGGGGGGALANASIE